ncbi:hypothetical protein BGX31_005205, partial [Mortierella sp. GBA43]
TYDRNHERDSFAERKDTKAISSAPSGNHWYERIKVSSRSAMLGGSSVIVVGTERMNVIFTNAVLKDSEKGSEEMEIGQSAGAGFEPGPTTRVFLSKDSIEAAQKHDGTQFAEGAAICVGSSPIFTMCLQNSDSAVLERKTVEKLDCGARVKLRKSVKSLLKHFKREGKNKLEILGDEKLAKELAKVASNLHDVVGASSRKLLKKG